MTGSQTAALWQVLADIDASHDKAESTRIVWEVLREFGFSGEKAPEVGVRGVIRVRTPDDKAPGWTARGDLVPGIPYSYSSGDVAVVVDWLAASAGGAESGLREALIAQADDPNVSDGFANGVRFAADFVGAWFSSSDNDPAKRPFRAGGAESGPEMAWLIERGQPEGLDHAEWWGVADSRTGAYGWVRSAFAADQFDTKAEAEAVIACFDLPNHPFHAHAVEHGFYRAGGAEKADAALPSEDAPTYEDRVKAMAEALHEDCRLEWQAVAVADPERFVTQHMADAHYGKAHDLVRRLPGLIGGNSVWLPSEDALAEALHGSPSLRAAASNAGLSREAAKEAAAALLARLRGGPEK